MKNGLNTELNPCLICVQSVAKSLVNYFSCISCLSWSDRV